MRCFGVLAMNILATEYVAAVQVPIVNTVRTSIHFLFAEA